eukprot:2017444-Pleurochrysis_carterae.AAC.3
MPSSGTLCADSQAITMLALDLYERARAADKPDLYPSPSVQAQRARHACMHVAVSNVSKVRRREAALFW